MEFLSAADKDLQDYIQFRAVLLRNILPLQLQQLHYIPE
ncbi:hypothetical protein COLO4_03789 [Corchorus olitorius]|uniref:Uncharacterized protein n=1 Tax=Corchorus olitorius TaxID=93759 RepID=A0A1R3KWR3_9ROSI|nr:hypothetical protein COLO4_03789 [Corchorus olitorius]